MKETESRRTDAVKLWCWRRLYKVPWTSRRSNQSILKDISPEYSLEWLMLKLQSFGHLMRRADSWKRPWCWERLEVGREGDSRGWDGWMASPTRWTWVWASSGSWRRTGRPGALQSMGSQSWTQLNNSTITMECCYGDELWTHYIREELQNVCAWEKQPDSRHYKV